MKPMKKVSLSAVCLLLAVGCSEPQSSLEHGIALPGPTPEQEVGQKLESLRDQPDELRSLLSAMPKGGDLHSHFSGAVSTESLIQWGAEDDICVDPKTFVASADCLPGDLPLTDAESNLELK